MYSDRKIENVFFWALTLIISIYLLYVQYSAEIPFDTGDGITHYMISRFSWDHPELFLHLWGKPFFTLVSSPFAQFGQTGMNVFQVLCGLSTGYFCFRIAQRLELQFAWMAPLLVCFAPIYFAHLNSGLTELFFGTVFMFVVWMFFEKKYFIAVLAASFLPFIRSEAYVILPLLALVLLARRQFIPMLLFPASTVIYGLIGYFHNGDILWLIHQNQSFWGDSYLGMKRELLHYIKHYEDFMGTPLSILILAGLARGFFLTYRFFFSKKSRMFPENIFLIYGSFFACLVLHMLLSSLPGIFNNLGMMRYMITIVPAASLISLHGLNLIFSIPILKSYWRNAFICLLFSFFIIYSALDRWYFPFRIGEEEKAIQEAAEWYKQSEFKSNKVYYTHPFLPFSLDADPFDNTTIQEAQGFNKEHPENSMERNSILIWDSHYGQWIEADSLLNNPDFSAVKHFVPEHEFYFGDKKFEVYVFRRK